MTSELRSACREVLTHIDNRALLDAALVRLREAFTASEERDGFASVVWSVDDVRGRRPDWTDERAKAWLETNGQWIQDAMVETGQIAIDELLSDTD